MEQSKKRFSGLWWVTVVVAVLLALLFAVETPLSAYAASEKGKYVKEVIMITATSLDGAKDKLKGINDQEQKVTDRDPKTYYLYETPIYDCDGQQTYIAYTTTNNRVNAAKSIKTMNMTGGWSYEEYDKYLDQLKDKANFLASDLYKAITEYVSVLNAGTNNAKYAKKMLDYFYEDDSKKTVSDFFVEMANKGSYENAKEEMITFVMQANASILSTIECVLLTVCADAYKGDTSIGDVNFLTGIQTEMFLSSLNGFLNNQNYAMYDTYVNNILNSLPKVQEDIKFYMNSGFMIEDTVEEIAAMEEEEITASVSEDSENYLKEYLEAKEEIRETATAEENEYGLSEEEQEAAKKLSAFDKYYKGLSVDDKACYTNGKMYYTTLKNIAYTGYFKDGKYEYENLLGLIMAHDNMEDYKKEDWYPLIHKMTPGQRALLNVGFPQLLYSVTVPSKMLDGSFDLMLSDLNKGAETEKEKIKDGDVVSVYNGIDRSLFKKNSGVALTSESIRKLSEKPLTHITTTSEKVGKICNIIAIAAGSVAATTMLTAAGCTIPLYLMFKEGFKEATTNMIEESFTPVIRYFFGKKVSSEVLKQWIILGEYQTEYVAQSFAGTTVSEHVPATFLRSLAGFLRVGFGAFLQWASYVAIGVMLIALAMKILYPIIAPEGDEPYINIPRVMCSFETIFGQKAEEGKDPEEDYIYYYGVKNPLLTNVDQQRALITEENDPDPGLNITMHMIGDVCDWRLKGMSRQWVAIYVSTDSKSGNPILADSFKVLSSSGDFNKTENSSLVPVVKFGNSTAFDFHLAYGAAENEDVPARYLGYEMEQEQTTQSGSVFSRFSVLGGLIAGIVLGGGAGALITYGVTKKRKKETVSQ